MHSAGTLPVWWNEAAHERRCERTLWVLMAVPK